MILIYVYYSLHCNSPQNLLKISVPLFLQNMYNQCSMSLTPQTHAFFKSLISLPSWASQKKQAVVFLELGNDEILTSTRFLCLPADVYSVI